MNFLQLVPLISALFHTFLRKPCKFPANKSWHILHTRSRKKDRIYPVKIRVTRRGEFYINLDIYVSNTQWEVTENKETRTKLGVIKNHALARQYNSLIAIRKAEIDKKLIFITANDTIARMDNKQLKDYLLQNGIEQQAYLFKEHYEKYCVAKTRATTLSTFRNTYIKISRFCNIDNLSFTQMGYEWVKEFDKFMEETGLSINARRWKIQRAFTPYAK